jgi:hypothetical protein
MSKKTEAALRTAFESLNIRIGDELACWFGIACYPWLSRTNASVDYALVLQRKRDTAAEPAWQAYERALLDFLA